MNKWRITSVAFKYTPYSHFTHSPVGCNDLE